MDDLKQTARRIRRKLVEMSYTAKTPHLGSALSCTDILVAAYWGGMRIDPSKPDNPSRDRFILSKGHAATVIYAALAYRGFYPMNDLDQYNRPGGKLPEHPSPGCVPGIECASGSLGHGLSIGCGMALASRLNGHAYRVFVCMSDGECNEGTVWEAALFAPANRLDNLIAIIDYNKWQATGRSDEVMSMRPLREKWESFGWHAIDIDGHDLSALVESMRNAPARSGRPTALVAHTVKGKGISFMEDNNDWHYRIAKEEDLRAAERELGLA